MHPRTFHVKQSISLERYILLSLWPSKERNPKAARYLSRDMLSGAFVSSVSIQVSWTRTRTIPRLSSNGACIVASQQASLDGSTFLELFPSLDVPSGSRFIKESIAFQESSVESNSVRLLVQQTV